MESLKSTLLTAVLLVPMGVLVWGNAVATLAGVLFLIPMVSRLVKRRRRSAFHFAIAAYILLFPVKLWFWQFELIERISVPHWWIFSAVSQIVAASANLIWLSCTRFRPVLTAVGLTYTFSLILQLFSYMYWSYGTASNFSVSLTHLDSFYFALGTFTTAGTGDISPTSETARGLQTLQMGFDFLLLGFIVVLAVTRYTNLLERPPKDEFSEIISPIPPTPDWSDAT